MRFSWKYGVGFIVLLIVEVIIAIYVHDRFIRPYVGDILVMVLMYTFIRTMTYKPRKLLPLYLFIFASGVEGLQYCNLVEVLGLQHNSVMSVIMGTVFDMKDIYCYGVGMILLMLWEYLCFDKHFKMDNI